MRRALRGNSTCGSNPDSSLVCPGDRPWAPDSTAGCSLEGRLGGTVCYRTSATAAAVGRRHRPRKNNSHPPTCLVALETHPRTASGGAPPSLLACPHRCDQQLRGAQVLPTRKTRTLIHGWAGKQSLEEAWGSLQLEGHKVAQHTTRRASTTHPPCASVPGTALMPPSYVWHRATHSGVPSNNPSPARSSITAMDAAQYAPRTSLSPTTVPQRRRV